MSKLFLCVFLFGTVGIAAAQVQAASCNTADVQSAINAATEGQTVTIPAGSCAWTGGVTIAGKGITVTGAGSSRIIAISSSTLALATGSQTLTVTSADPGVTLSVSAGQTLTIEETGTTTNFLTGTVTSYNSGTGNLVMNITNVGGTCKSNSLSNCKRWLVISTPTSVTNITNNNNTNTPLFNITEDTSFNTNVGNIQISAGTGNAHVYFVNYASGGQAVLIHDCRISGNPNNGSPPNGDATMIETTSNRGVIWNCSFDSSPFNISTLGAIGIKDSSNLTGNSWTSASAMGNLDSTGQGKLYIEDSDFHAMGFATSTDDNGRMAVRYSLYDNSEFGTHGADTSSYGQRYFEFYNNVMVFEGYNDGTTFNLNNWFYLRGGTAILYNNVIPALQSTDYGTKPDINMTVMNLQRNSGPDSCWGAGTSGGADRHAPRQVGYGYITGTGTSPNNGGATHDSVTYVGDSEPLYFWSNSREPLNTYISDYGGNACSSPDTSANYIQSGRDFFDQTAKPGWSPYTYPHPLRSGSGGGPLAPTGLQAVVN